MLGNDFNGKDKLALSARRTDTIARTATVPWPAITDDDHVERVIVTTQTAVVSEAGGKPPYND